MLLSYIVQELDAELDRLHRLRTLVVSLETTFVLNTLPLPDQPATPPAAPAAAKLTAAEPVHLVEASALQTPAEGELAATKPRAVPSRAAGRPRGARKVSRSPQPRALAGSGAPAPAKVVVVSAEQLRRERADREVAHASPARGESSQAAPEQAPESLARSLAARWLGGNGGAATT